MKLIVGLGNPGLRYRNTRHNIGFLVVSSLAKKHGIRIKKRLFKGLIGEGRIDGKDIQLFLPQTFMNLSGEPVALAANRISGLSSLLVVYDDIDLSLGNIRFRFKGSGGGHKGLISIIDSLNSEEFPRLRIGIQASEKAADTANFVLRPFSKEEKGILGRIIDEAISGIETWVSSGIDVCMRKYNRKNAD
ncbi:MAG: aminoacyl-tRNA hydrolase [Candidatus Omnitrophica bacterium]|nr:aminoacyl-tRNA hydrolase [Candidatus Omnitrophota bacterium]